MTIGEAIISGILQGVTEFFPVSSSAHLVLLHHYFGFESSQVFFDIILHVATGMAVLLFFFNDVKNIFIKEKDAGIMIFVACFPTFVIGFLFADFFEKFFVNIKMVAVALIINGIWLVSAGIVNKKNMRKASAQAKAVVFYPWKAVVIGIAQGIALIPGISRSGSTISTGLLLGLGGNLAFRFSFLLLLPTTLGAVVYKLKFISGAIPSYPVLLAGAACAFFVGFFTLNALKSILAQGKMHIFGFYCLILGLAVLLW